jgi:hypothetical protein
MKCKLFIYIGLCFILTISTLQQIYSQQAYLQGKVTEVDGTPVVSASITVSNTYSGTATDSSGRFSIRVPAQILFTCVISYVGFKQAQRTIQVAAGQTYQWNVILERDTRVLSEVEVRSGNVVRLRPEISVTKISPQTVKALPSAFGDFNKILATLPGVVSNNELSSTYSVRGGNYDENLVYVNGIEVYRPFLVRSGQQEGLSFVNPDLVENVDFSSGGWQSKYGDKLSSVLDIAYKTPDTLAGSLTLGLLGGAAHLEGTTLNKRVSYIAWCQGKTFSIPVGYIRYKRRILAPFY